MVCDSKRMLDSIAAITAINHPDIGLLIHGSFPLRFFCPLIIPATKMILSLCRLLPELVLLFIDISLENTFEDLFTLPTYSF